MSPLASAYYDRSLAMLAAARANNAAVIAALTPVIGASVARGEVVHTFGSGHSEIIAREIVGRAGEVVIVISNSGKNSSPLEVALHAKKKGCIVVGLCSETMSSTAKTVHPGGKNLHALADYVLDNGGVPGDTVMTLTPEVATGPTSTFIGASLLNWLMLSVMEWLKDHGHPLPVLRSQNIPGAIEHNRRVGAPYKHRLSKQLA